MRLVLAVLTWIAFAPAISFAEPQPYSMRGVQLGITLDQFKAFPPPLAPSETDPRVTCTPDAPDLALDPIDRQVGVVSCEWRVQVAVPSMPGGRPFPPFENTGTVLIGDGQAGAQPRFDFITDTDGAYRLFRIALETGSVVWSDIYPSFRDGYGPGAEEVGQVQNAYGASFADIKNHWSNTASSITIEQRCRGRVDRMCITYTHAALLDLYLGRRKAALGKPLL